jgi:c-di-GMP-binding flagellar brake protein YcgR
MEIPFKVGEFLFLQQKDVPKSELIVYKSRVADLNKEYITIEVPMATNSNKYGFFAEKTELEAWVFAPDGSKYQFKTKVVGRRKEGIPVTLLSYPKKEETVRTQRREFIRVPCTEELAIHPEEKAEVGFVPFLTKTLDVSGGGLSFSLPGKPPFKDGVNLRWFLYLPLPSGPTLYVSGKGRMVRMIPPKEPGLAYKFPVQFTDVTEVERQKIMRFCFERQLQLRNKGIDI